MKTKKVISKVTKKNVAKNKTVAKKKKVIANKKVTKKPSPVKKKINSNPEKKKIVKKEKKIVTKKKTNEMKIVKKKLPPRKGKITKKSQSTKALKTSKVKETDLDKQILDLIDRGKTRGFVTEEEIIHIIPDIENDIEHLEALYDELEKKNIKIEGTVDIIEISEVKEDESKKSK
ncbi:hypothetical protein KAJ41_00595, partial [Candidatus Parcubacteria bacterium]|nr:hypothetical protein [Candidatus Parcubacteria bacterium]